MWKKLKQLTSGQILVALVGLSVLSLLLAFILDISSSSQIWANWLANTFQGFGTEMLGAAVTFGLVELILNRRQREEDEKRRIEERKREKRETVEAQKQLLIVQMRSADNSTALAAIEQFKVRGWHRDGSLHKAYLAGAKLSGASLISASLQDVDLSGTDLTNASLVGTDLSNANLAYTDLRGADMRDAILTNANLNGTIFDKKTIIPDGRYWSPAVQLH